MKDRDSLQELYSIMKEDCSRIRLTHASAALEHIAKYLGLEYDVFYRRRLSVCRMLVDLHLPISNDDLDVLLSVSLINHLPDDCIPPNYENDLIALFADIPEVENILSLLRQVNYKDLSYYKKLTINPYALMIRLIERSVLVEKLYEWNPIDALRFIRETRESFFPLCLYMKEHYPEFLSPVSVIHEKMRNLTTVNEALLTRFLEIEYAISDEILSLREENTAIRAMINELQNVNGSSVQAK